MLERTSRIKKIKWCYVKDLHFVKEKYRKFPKWCYRFITTQTFSINAEDRLKKKNQNDNI